MPNAKATLSRAVVRVLNRLGFFAAAFLTLMVPLGFAAFTLQGTRNSLALENLHVARSLERIVMDRPDLWEFEVLRIQDLVDRPTLHGEPEDRSVQTLEGRVLVQSEFHAPAPVLVSSVPIHDSGRVVGLIVARRSIRDRLIQTLLVALGSALVGWGLFFTFRQLPIRALGRALADLSEERLKTTATLRAIPEGVIAVDARRHVTFLNPVAEAFLGWTSETAIGRALAEVYPVQRAEEPVPGAPASRGEIRVQSGPLRVIEERFSALPVEMDGRSGQVIVFRDITNQLKTEAELLRVRQIESLGVLAGGIAHDFNNYLSAILGNISLAKQDLPPGNRASERLTEAMKATDRARSLSLKLLTFAKGGDPSRRVVDLAPVVREAAEFVTHGTGVLFTCTFEPGLWNAEVDDGLLSQVIHNLVINAVQAMQGQGHIHLRIENLTVGRGDLPNLKPGRYLRVSIQDSGPGIPEAVMPRIFEPYFTTKHAGNGLGLASCFNIMRAHEGGITAESPEGGGARFTLYVPATDQAMTPRPAAYLTPSPTGRGRVLVMEDDPVLQEVAAEMLERTGFTARTCSDGESAIRLYSQSLKSGSPYCAVIMDLTIPGGMGGREAATRILAMHPEARLIVSSGYSVDPVLARPADYGFRAVLTKPYGLADLTRVMEEVSLART